jgi:thiosulfate reductase cytochrome b subunit
VLVTGHIDKQIGGRHPGPGPLVKSEYPVTFPHPSLNNGILSGTLCGFRQIDGYIQTIRCCGHAWWVVMDNVQQTQWVRIHPLTVRITHWVNVMAIVIMVTSGWRIYDASPLFNFIFPTDITLGGWLAGALLWHFAAMWLLVINTLIYLTYGFLSGHFHRKLWPLSPGAVLSDILAAFRGRLSHEDLSVYNSAQRAAYASLILAVVVLVLSGLSIWKPVQFQEIAGLMGGYEGARRVHFFAMTFTVFVVAVHVVMVVLYPRTLLTMFSGRYRRRT